MLDKACVLSILKETGRFKLDKIKSLDLKGNLAVEKLVSQLKPLEMVLMTDRSITARGQVINIYSGNSHDLFGQSDHINHQSASQCQPIALSNKNAFTFINDEKFQFVVVIESSSRETGSIGHFGLAQAKTCVTIAENT